MLTSRNLPILHWGAPYDFFKITIKRREIVVAAKSVNCGYAVALFYKRGGVTYSCSMKIFLKGCT